MCNCRILEIYLACHHFCPQAVALLSEMPSRGIKPDVVCYGATITALSEVAGTQNRIAWGARAGARGQGGESTRAHEKAVALIQQMRRKGPRCGGEGRRREGELLYFVF